MRDHLRPPGRYWNHNTAYHPWLIRSLRSAGGDVLDVGCGDGLLLEKLAPHVHAVVGVECDPQSATMAEMRARDLPNARVRRAEFLADDLAPASFDGVVFVASLHHMDSAAALAKAKRLLRPGGQLLVVGLARSRSPADWAAAVFATPLVWVASTLRRELRERGHTVCDAGESMTDIRRLARELLPGASLRRGLYYRYLLRWVAPGPTPSAASGSRRRGG